MARMQHKKPEWLGLIMVRLELPATHEEWGKVCEEFGLLHQGDSIWFSQNSNIRVHAQEGIATLMGRTERDWRDVAILAYGISRLAVLQLKREVEVVPGTGVDQIWASVVADHR
jgi:hypothetical protein